MRKQKSGSVQDKTSRFLFFYCNIPQGTTGILSVELLLGRRPRSHLDLLKPDLNQRVEREQEKQKHQSDIHSRVHAFNINDIVYIWNLSQGSTPHWLPGTISASAGPLSFKVTLEDGCTFR